MGFRLVSPGFVATGRQWLLFPGSYGRCAGWVALSFFSDVKIKCKMAEPLWKTGSLSSQSYSYHRTWQPQP